MEDCLILEQRGFTSIMARNRGRQFNPETFDITPRYLPKNGRGAGFTFGGKYCKDVCSLWNNKKPFAQDFSKKFYCRSCEGWFTHDKLNERGRCQCCNRMVRLKPRK